MRIIKPMRVSLVQRAFEIRRERRLALGVAAFVPFEAPERPLPEISMWQELAKQAGKDVAVDEGLPKPRGEVLVFGRGFAPGGRPRPAFLARVQVGSIDKSIYVVGKRRWERGVPSEPEPLTELVLGWDKAFGGPGFAANPLGMGFSPIEEGGKKVHPLPQLEDPRRLIKSPGDTPTPAAFGALDPSWPERQSKAGTYDSKWLENEFPGLARDIDPEYFMLAPLDQRAPGYFQGGERIVIENLHAEEPTIETHVTRLSARCFITRRGGAEDALEEVVTRLETLVLLPNARRMVALFRGVTPIVDDDADDITCALAALELRGSPRSLEHYRSVLAARLDKKKGHLVALRDKDMLPEPDPGAPALPDEKYSDMEDLLAREGVMERRGRERAERELAEVRKATRVLGLDPDERGIPRELPEAQAPPKIDELAEYIEQVNEEAARLEAEAKARQEASLEQARKSLAEHGVDLDEVMERTKSGGGGPPAFRADSHLDRMRETAAAGRALGAPMEALEAQIEDPVFVGKLRWLEEAQLVVYRTAAHQLPPAPTPTDDARRVMRERAFAALASKSPMNGWDLTGADLRDLNFEGASLREALLEGADLRGAALAGADLTGAVLTRADLSGVRLAGAKLEGANLGEVRAKGASFEGARMAKAVFERGDLGEARMAGADLRGGLVLEARMPGADLTGVLADEVLFSEVDFTGAKLDRASLRKATLFRCQLEKASFVEATLEGAGLVEVKGEGSSFRGARANNLRLVLRCELASADFAGAELASATLRGASLQGADFTGIRADGCDFGESDLTSAKLAGASLKGSRLMRTELRNADLARANLMEAMLQYARVSGANFADANLFRANLSGAEGDARTSFKGAHVARALFPRRRG